MTSSSDSNTANSPGNYPTKNSDQDNAMTIDTAFRRTSSRCTLNGENNSRNSEKSDGSTASTSLQHPLIELNPKLLQRKVAMKNKLQGNTGRSDFDKKVLMQAIEELHQSFENCPPEDAEVADPPHLMLELLPHQRRALSWMIWRETQYPAGGILADDMGLGKTLTVLSLILMQRNSESTEQEDQNTQPHHGFRSNSTLIICPASVLSHWESEIKKHICPAAHLTYTIYYGKNRDSDITSLAKLSVVLTTYDVIRLEVEAIEKAGNPAKLINILKIKWRRIVLDEGHKIKNWKSKTAKAICALHAGIHWVVTGTPVHNELMDLFSLVVFLKFQPFDDPRVWKNACDHKADKERSRLKTILRSLVLRRTKSQEDSQGRKLVPLPEKITHVHHLQLSRDEQRVHDQILELSKAFFKYYVAELRRRAAMDESQNTPLNATYFLVLLLRLRQCCCHLSLIKGKEEEDSDEEADGNVEAEQEEPPAIAEAARLVHVSEAKNLVSAIPREFPSPYFNVETPSAKISLLLEILQEIFDNNNRVKCVIVSEFTTMLRIIKAHLTARGYKCHAITGEVPVPVRADVVNDFNNNPKGNPILLLSLKAGGLGLNLVGGNHLFIMDPPWNPQLENQACDRIYRVGQTKTVHIHKLICENTVEKKVLELQQKKLNLAADFLSAAKSRKNTHATVNDLMVLFGNPDL